MNSIHTAVNGLSKSLKFQKGFTLLELMVAVGIVAMLVAIGIPTYRRMIYTSRQSEAKVSLAGIYMANEAFYSQFQTYGDGIEIMGAGRKGDDNLYSTGFPADANCGSAGAFFPAGDPRIENAIPDYDDNTKNKTVLPASVTPTCTGGDGLDKVTQSTFTAVAVGNLVNGATSHDIWTINQNKSLKHDFDGTSVP